MQRHLIRAVRVGLQMVSKPSSDLAPSDPGLFLIAWTNARRALIWIGSEHPSGFRIDQVQPRRSDHQRPNLARSSRYLGSDRQKAASRTVGRLISAGNDAAMPL